MTQRDETRVITGAPVSRGQLADAAYVTWAPPPGELPVPGELLAPCAATVKFQMSYAPAPSSLALLLRTAIDVATSGE